MPETGKKKIDIDLDCQWNKKNRQGFKLPVEYKNICVAWQNIDCDKKRHSTRFAVNYIDKKMKSDLHG